MTVHHTPMACATEAGDYELAAHHLLRDLVLAPNAKDVVKDKLVLWQLKAKEGA